MYAIILRRQRRDNEFSCYGNVLLTPAAVAPATTEGTSHISGTNNVVVIVTALVHPWLHAPFSSVYVLIMYSSRTSHEYNIAMIGARARALRELRFFLCRRPRRVFASITRMTRERSTMIAV